MRKRNLARAVAFAAAALFLCPAGVVSRAAGTGAPDAITTPLLERVAAAPWAESMAGHAAPLPPPERMELVRSELEFAAWLADRCPDTTSPSIARELEERRAELRRETLHTRLVDRLRPAVTHDDVRAYSARLGWDRPIPELHEVVYILVEVPTTATARQRAAAEERARAIREMATPDNFTELARIHSDAPSSERGGVMGHVDLSRMGPTFAEHVRRTPVGQVGGPYPTRSGWNIILLRGVVASAKRSVTKDPGGFVASARATEMIQAAAETTGGLAALMDREGITTSPLVDAEVRALRNHRIARLCVAQRAEALTTPTQAELMKFYGETSPTLRASQRRRAREILVTGPEWTDDPTTAGWLARRAVRDRARLLRDAIVAGDDFTSVARAHSAAPSAAHGGDLGWLAKPSGYLVDTALDALEPGGVSPPLFTRRGYVLFQLVEVEPPRTPTFDEAEEQLLVRWRVARAREIERGLRAEFTSEAR